MGSVHKTVAPLRGKLFQYEANYTTLESYGVLIL